MQVKIPIRIVSEANSSEHWTKKSKRHKLQHMIVKSYLNQMPICTLPCRVTLTRSAPRKLDGQDNLRMAFKWIVDAIATYLTGNTTPGQADSDTRITWNYCQEKTKAKEYFILIQIEPL